MYDRSQGKRNSFIPLPKPLRQTQGIASPKIGRETLMLENPTFLASLKNLKLEDWETR